MMTAPIEVKENQVSRLTITAKSNIITFDAEGRPHGFRKERGIGGSNMLALHFDGNKITKKIVKKWMNENDEYFQNICLHSDLYAQIEDIYELKLSFKAIPISGQGYVILKQPKRFPHIFSPNSEAYCFFLCIDEAGIQFRGVTHHQVKQEQSISSFVFMSKIPSIITYFSTPVQIILHNSKNGRFPTLTKHCVRIPKEAQKNKTTIHIGHVVGHYFLIRNTQDLNTLTADDFERIDGKDDYLISKLVSTNPVRIHYLVKVGGKMLYEDRTDIPITDEAIEKRIKSYKGQDKKAKRGVVPLFRG